MTAHDASPTFIVAPSDLALSTRAAIGSYHCTLTDSAIEMFPWDAVPTEYKKGPALLQTVLLAEDNNDLREAMTYFLETMNFRVVACSNAELASRAFHSSPVVDILLTDLQMPGRSGLQLARELTAFRPSLPVLIVSGSILSDELLDEIKERQWMFLSKPCQLIVLVENIHVLLKTCRRLAA